MPDVADLLRLSRAENLMRLRFGNRRQANYVVAEQHAKAALELRLQAHEADPDHIDAEWQNDTVPHQQMVEFLTQYADIP